MTRNRIQILGTVVGTGEWLQTPKGDWLREVDVIAKTKRAQYYSLTQFVNKECAAIELMEGTQYLFEAFTNGILIDGKHENKICITRIHQKSQ